MENKFDGTFDDFCCPGDTINAEVDGFKIVAKLMADYGHGSPWDEEDGHGPVSDWTSRDKRPGERILNSNHGSYRYYDVEEAIKIAKRDGWDAPPYGGTLGEKASRAVERDYEALKAWCNDEWYYGGVSLMVSKEGVVLEEFAASLWGIAVNHPHGDNSYLTEVANELLDEAIRVGKAQLEKLLS